MLVKVIITPNESSGVQGQIPSLIDATSDELLCGLSQDIFSSVDLVNVRCYIFLQVSVQRHYQLTYFPGVSCQNERRKSSGESHHGIQSGCLGDSSPTWWGEGAWQITRVTYPESLLLEEVVNVFRPLHGLPVLIKGNIGTRDSMQTNGKLYMFYKSR